MKKKLITISLIIPILLSAAPVFAALSTAPVASTNFNDLQITVSSLDNRRIILVDPTGVIIGDTRATHGFPYPFADGTYTNGVGDLIQKLKPGERIVVIPISDRFSGSVLLDRALRADAGYLGLRERADREAIGAEWRSIAQAIKPVYGRTDILGALASLPYRSSVGTGASRIYIFSDLQQDSPQLDLEHALSISVVPAIARLKQVNAIPHLTGARVYALGVDPVGKSAQYYAKLREFWSAYFAAAGAQLKAFSFDRSIPEF